MRACRPALDADQKAARVHVPVRRAESGERGDEIHVVVARQPGRQRLGLRGRRDDPEPVAQPLHRRTRDERASLERVADTVARVPRDSREKTAAGQSRAVRRVHEQEASGPVRVLRLSGGEARLAEERGLLVAGDSRDGQASPEVLCVGLRDEPARSDRRGQHRPRD